MRPQRLASWYIRPCRSTKQAIHPLSGTPPPNSFSIYWLSREISKGLGWGGGSGVGVGVINEPNVTAGLTAQFPGTLAVAKHVPQGTARHWANDLSAPPAVCSRPCSQRELQIYASSGQRPQGFPFSGLPGRPSPGPSI